MRAFFDVDKIRRGIDWKILRIDRGISDFFLACSLAGFVRNYGIRVGIAQVDTAGIELILENIANDLFFRIANPVIIALGGVHQNVRTAGKPACDSGIFVRLGENIGILKEHTCSENIFGNHVYSGTVGFGNKNGFLHIEIGIISVVIAVGDYTDDNSDSADQGKRGYQRDHYKGFPAVNIFFGGFTLRNTGRFRLG